MFILPPGHHEQVTKPRIRRPRDRWMLGAGGACLAILAIALVISFTSHKKKSAHGCIDVSAATVIGGSELYRCGEGARNLCLDPSEARAYTDHAFTEALDSACRKAGLPIAASS